MLFGKYKTSCVCLVISIFIFFAISLIIFNNVYLTSKILVDEKFHLPLGLSYCNFNYFVWDPKVTTLPGLYLVSSLIMGPFNLCTTYWLRFVSLIFSIINILLFYVLFSKYEKNEWGNILSSITLALLPPLYFCSHIYYTEVVSLTMILLTVISNEKGYHYFSSIFGLFSVICRQTNIIWVAFVAGRYVLNKLYSFSFQRYSPTEQSLPAKELRNFVTRVLKEPARTLSKTTFQFWLDTFSYLAVLGAFVLFLIINGSIVVGDKDAHGVNIHIPQLFYFSLFCLIFAWPHFVGEVLSFLTFSRRHKLLICISLIVASVIVFTNTLVHPYMLADNRHYLFYIWNRFYGKYSVFRYGIIPVYIFAWYVIIKLLYDKNDISFLLLYLFCVTFVLVTQKLITFRYFFIPYILFRVRIKSNANSVFNIVLEFVTYLVMNCITFNLFFTKSIVWSEYEEPQRLMW